MDARTLLSLVRGMPRGDDHGAALEGFYGAQAKGYDRSRERLLHGRGDLIAALDLHPGQRVLDIGGGTGRNLDFFAERVPTCASVEILDLCRPLLDRAAERVAERGWNTVILTHGDVCTDRPVHTPVDRIICSYSLSMIPDWQDALDRALTWLRPGGLIGVVDYYISEARPACDRQRHPAITRCFWPRWFRHVQVHLRQELLPRLTALTDQVVLRECRGHVPLLPFWCKAPYLMYVGRKTVH